VLARRARLALAGAIGGILLLAILAVVALHGEKFIPVGSAMATLVAAAAVAVARARHFAR